jgi:hypothetical protein
MRRRLMLIVLAISATPAIGREIFVDNVAGDDRFCGNQPIATTDVNGPVRTIGKALRLTLSGDRVVLANTAEPYRECVALQGERHSGSAVKPFILNGNGAILDGSDPVPDDAWIFVLGDIFRFQPPRLAYQQLFIGGKPVVRKNASADQPLPELAPLEWCLYNGWIYFCGEPGKIPQQYAPRYAGRQIGITLYKVHDVVIHDLTVQGFQLDGINAHDGVRDGRLLSVTCRGNGRAGVCVAGGSRVELAGCTLGDNGAAQLLLDEYSLTRVYNSLLIPNTAPAIVQHGGTRLYVDGTLIDDRTRDVELERP